MYIYIYLFYCINYNIAEKYRPEPAVKPRTSCLTYERSTN